MHGFIFGTACLAALAYVIHRHHHGIMLHHACGRRMILRRVFMRLDTTPGQEKAIVQAIDELAETLQNTKREFKPVRAQVAEVMRSVSADDAAFEALHLKIDSLHEPVRDAIRKTFVRVHEVLDERQRKLLADMIEQTGGCCRPRHHSCRCGCAC